MKYITANAIVAKVIRDFNIADLGWVEDAKLYWVKEALQSIGTNGNKVLVKQAFDITNQSITLPCEAEDLIGITSDGCFLRFQNQYNLMSFENTETIRPYVDNGVIKFNSVGRIQGIVYYTTFPDDCKDEPLVVDHVKVTEAIMYYIMLKLQMRGFKHPVISYTDAYNLWEKARPKAGNFLAFPKPYEISLVLSDFPNPA